jgi:hypothetical protein
MTVEELEVIDGMNPFIPGTDIQYAWDASSIGPLKLCGRLRHYKSQGWRPKEDSVHLRFGGEYHKCLQDYEVLKAEGFTHADAVFDVVKALTLRLEDWNPDHTKKNRKTLVRSVIWRLEKYRDDAAKTWIMSDGKPAVEITFNFPLDVGPTQDQPYVLCGKLDRIVVFNGDLFVMDHKTTTVSLTESYWKQFSLDDQMSLYTLAGKVVFQAPIKGVIVDAAQILVGGTNFDRGIVYRTQQQLDEWIENTVGYLNRQNDNMMNTASCITRYGPCEFLDVCTKTPQVRERFLKSGFQQVAPWNPLNPMSD